MIFSRQHIATFLAILFHVSGAVGILCTPYKEWFIRYTPLNLCLMAALLVWNQPAKKFSFVFFFLIAFVTGMAAEIIGVHTGILFGKYRYGNVLGAGVLAVPWMIGLNWFVVVLCSGSVMRQVQDWFRKRFVKNGAVLSDKLSAVSLVIDGALLAVFFDWIMEPVAMKLGFWQWQNDDVPLYNYFCWFIISALLLMVYRTFSFSGRNHFAVHLFMIQALFFLVLRTYL